MDPQGRNHIAQPDTVAAPYGHSGDQFTRTNRTGFSGYKGDIGHRCRGRSTSPHCKMSTFGSTAEQREKVINKQHVQFFLWHTNRMSCHRRDGCGPSHRMRWIWLAAVLSLTACAQAQQWGAVQPASQKAAQPGGKVDLHLDPGCPLGATVQQGLNVVEESCRPSPRTNPPGPVGTSKP